MIGLPAVTLGLIAIDKHASGALPRNRTIAPTFPMLVCSQPQGRVSPGWWGPRQSPCRETGVLGAVSVERPSVRRGAAWLLKVAPPLVVDTKHLDQFVEVMERRLGLIHSSAAFGQRNWGWLEGRSALGVSYILPWGCKVLDQGESSYAITVGRR